MPVSNTTVVIAGAGLMGRWHAHYASALSGRIAAIVDRDADRAQRLARRFGARAVATIEALDPPGHGTVLHVCTPAQTHLELAHRGLERGYHVICEKPIGSSVACVAELLAAAQRRERLVCPVHQFAFQSAVERTVAELAGRNLIRHLSFQFCTAGGLHQPLLLPDELALEILPHPLSIMARLQPGLDLASASWTQARPRPGEWSIGGQCGDVTASILISTSARPTRALCSVFASDRTVHIDLYHDHRVIERGNPGRFDKITRPVRSGLALVAASTTNLVRRTLTREPAYPGLRELLRRFYCAAAGRGPPPFSGAEVLAAYAARDAIGRVPA